MLTKKFDAAMFSVSYRWWSDLWGGGHTRETDPETQGWRCVKQRANHDLVVVGQRGVKGCASALKMPNGRADVAIYDELTPEDVSGRLAEGSVPADQYLDMAPTPGWGLTVLEYIRQARG